MHWCRRAWNYIRQKVDSAVELAREHVVITSLFAGSSVASVVYYSLHSINATASGNIALLQISSINGYFVGLTSAAFLPIGIIVGGGLCLLMIVSANNYQRQNDRQQIAALIAVTQQQADEMGRLTAERRVADVVLNAHEIAVVAENGNILAELEQLREQVRELNGVQVDAGLVNAEAIEILRQELNEQAQIINQQGQMLEDINQAFRLLRLAPAGAPPGALVANLLPDPAGAPPVQRRANAYR